MSQGGDLVCAQSPRKDDEDLDAALNPAAWEPGAFGCFRLRDGVRLWKLPVRQNEQVSGAAFTLDDKMVVILTVWSGQMSLRLLDATNGMLVRQHDFAGRRQEEAFRSTNLIMRADEVWMTDEEEQKMVLLHFPLVTLQPLKVDCPPLDGFQGGVRLAPDGRHILLVGNGFATCLGLVNGRWQPVYEDNDFNMIALGGPSGNFLTSAHFMPDGRSIVLASDDSARLTDLATKKTRRIKLNACHGVCPSPDGSYLLVQHDNGLQVVSVRETDVTDPAQHRQHFWGPHLLRFAHDGKTLFASDAEGVWVWDVATRKPRAWLKSYDRHDSIEGTFRTMALLRNETELLSEEFNDFLHWKLPPSGVPPPEAPVIVKPELAFGGVRSTEMGSWAYSGVFADPEGKWIVSVDRSNRAVIHRGLGAAVTRSSQKEIPAVNPEHWFFGPDDTFTFHSEIREGWHRMDLQQGTVSEVSSLRDEPVAVLPKRQMMVCEGKGGIIRACTIDGKTQLPNFEKPARGFSIFAGFKGAASLDERRCGWVLVNDVTHRQHVFVWEVETGRLLGQAQLPTNDISSIALSPDGAVVACGHANTSISLWEVAKLATLPASTAPARVAVQPVQPRPPAPGSPPSSPTVRREHPFGSGLWDIRENGTVTKGEALPEAGLLRVDGNTFTSRACRLTSPFDLNRFQKAQMDFDTESRPKPGDARFRPIVHREYSAVAAGLIQISEGEAGEVWVSRQIGNPGGTRGAFLTFTDAITHRGSQEKQIVTEFEVRFPALTKSLVDSSFKPVQIEPDGALKLAQDALWIAALPEAGKSVTVPVFMFRSASGGQASRLLWKAETSTLTVRHPVTLVPGETRWMMHALRVVTLKEGESPAQFTVPAVIDHGVITALSVSKNAINFGPPSGLEPYVFERLRSARKRPDEFGASWEEDVDRSLVNGTTTSKAHQLWLDDAPLPFSSKGAFLLRDTLRQEPPPGGGGHVWVDGSNLNRSITVTRSTGSNDQSLPLIIDHFINQTDQPVKSNPVYISTFTEPVRALYDASGRPVEVGATPVKASTLGGSLILEFAGANRPSTALVFYQDGAVAEPKISWPSPKMLKIEYDFAFPPKKMVTFWHGATQRNLASFGSVTEAFTGALPFKRNPTDSSDGYMNVK
ncbi:MAG: hypothetical protein U1F71_04360 [Verrucomicrobiaceae bacterium]